MNAYSSGFAQDIEALSSVLSEMLSRLDGADGADPGMRTSDAFLLAEPHAPRKAAEGRPSLPDPRLVRRIIRQRQLRTRFFSEGLFADPAWDMLLDLAAATAEHARVPVTSLCHASGVPPTTALRWIGVLSEAGLVKRVEDQSDRRRAFIALTDKAADQMARFFAEIGGSAIRMP